MILTKQKVFIENMTTVYDAYKLIEKIGRVCYKSEDRITHDSSIAFVKNLVKKDHLSVIEHIHVTARFITNRGVTHELVRHRLASFSQESTRYCNYSRNDHLEFIIPHWLDIKEGIYNGTIQSSDEKVYTFMRAMLHAEHSYLLLLKEGMKPQDARAVLPINLKTEIVVTANLREWLHILDLRTSTVAHPDMRKIMKPLQNTLYLEYPEIFKEIKE